MVLLHIVNLSGSGPTKEHTYWGVSVFDGKPLICGLKGKPKRNTYHFLFLFLWEGGEEKDTPMFG